MYLLHNVLNVVLKENALNFCYGNSRYGSLAIPFARLAKVERDKWGCTRQTTIHHQLPSPPW